MSKKKNFHKLHLAVHVVCVILILGVLVLPKLPGVDETILSVMPRLSISREDGVSAKELMGELGNKDFVLINVHTPYAGEIPHTDTFIEYDSFMASKDRLPEDKNAKIILYCQSGSMSAQALKTLKNMGYTNVSHLEGGMLAWQKEGLETLDLARLPEKVTPSAGFTLPLSWGDIGPALVQLGVIDKEKFGKAVKMDENQRRILEGEIDAPITINYQNSQFVVDMLWALGLAQKSMVYSEGPMGKEYADRASNFASTGGWTLARGDAMEHYNRHDLIPLTQEQHERVMLLAENIYRPCCGNHTAFPDCNHGMAALAATELMVAKGLSDEEIYKNILKLNSFWFPQNYITAATYFERQGITWESVDAKLVLGSEFSSGQGAAQIAQELGPLPYLEVAGGSCGA